MLLSKKGIARYIVTAFRDVPRGFVGSHLCGLRGHDISWYYAETEGRSMPSFFILLRRVLG
jgi:hypothetical protein